MSEPREQNVKHISQMNGLERKGLLYNCMHLSVRKCPAPSPQTRGKQGAWGRELQQVGAGVTESASCSCV